jgi:hypothetical protein
LRPEARVQQRPTSGPTDPLSTPLEQAPSTVTDAVRVQILATEHWSLLATRSLAWTEAYSRAGIFLTVLSAAVVAMALVGQAGTQRDFILFALVLLPVVLFLGLATYVRLVAINNDDGRLLNGMNRLRHGYLDIAPELEPYFITGHHDDVRGLAQTLGLGENFFRRFPFQVLASTPGVVGSSTASSRGSSAAWLAVPWAYRRCCRSPPASSERCSSLCCWSPSRCGGSPSGRARTRPGSHVNPTLSAMGDATDSLLYL